MRQLRTLGAGVLADGDQLLVVALRSRRLLQRFGRLAGAIEAEETVRLLLDGCVEGHQRFLRPAGFEQHEAEQLARRRERAGRHRRLVGGVFGVGGRRQRLDGVVLFPFGEQHPRFGHAALDVHLLGPVRVLHVEFARVNLGQLGDVRFRVIRLPRTRGANRAREMGDRLGVRGVRRGRRSQLRRVRPLLTLHRERAGIAASAKLLAPPAGEPAGGTFDATAWA